MAGLYSECADLPNNIICFRKHCRNLPYGIAVASFFYYRSITLFDGDVCAAFTAVVIRSALAVRRFFAIWRAISVIVFILSVLIFV